MFRRNLFQLTLAERRLEISSLWLCYPTVQFSLSQRKDFTFGKDGLEIFFVPYQRLHQMLFLPSPFAECLEIYILYVTENSGYSL